MESNFIDNFEFDVQTICSVDTVSYGIFDGIEDTHTGLTITSSVLL